MTNQISQRPARNESHLWQLKFLTKTDF